MSKFFMFVMLILVVALSACQTSQTVPATVAATAAINAAEATATAAILGAQTSVELAKIEAEKKVAVDQIYADATAAAQAAQIITSSLPISTPVAVASTTTATPTLAAATPMPTPVSPTATSVPVQPAPAVTNTNTASNTTTAAPATNDCEEQPTQAFKALWEANASVLGCALPGHRETIGGAAENFEGGRMFWINFAIEGKTYSYALTDSNMAWKRFTGWDNTDPEPTIDIPTGKIHPRRGFGWIWREFYANGSTDALGWATEGERATTVDVQLTQNGMMVRVDNKAYGLIGVEGGSFVKID